MDRNHTSKFCLFYLQFHLSRILLIFKRIKGWITFRNYESKVQLFYSDSNDSMSKNSSSRSASSLSAQSNEWDCVKVRRIYLIIRNGRVQSQIFKF